MLLEKLSKYINDAEKADVIWKGIILPVVDIEDLLEMNQTDREKYISLLDDDEMKKIEKFKEGGMI